jgi:hypothetical protein
MLKPPALLPLHPCAPPFAAACAALQQNEFVRPGFELGFKVNGKYYIRNHLQFNILVHPTHGEYMRARQGAKDGAVLDNVNARKLLVSRQQLLQSGVSEEQLSSMEAGRQLAEAPAGGPADRPRRAGWGAFRVCGGVRAAIQDVLTVSACPPCGAR